MNLSHAHVPTPELSALVADEAHGILIDAMSGYGNTVSPAHSSLLARLLRDFADLALGIKKGRFAYPLNCGLGKTQSIIAFCVALHQLDIPLSVAVAASKVEALCELKRHLMAHGVPQESIGLTHSYDCDPQRAEAGEPFASLPATLDNDTRQFHLVTHSRIRGGAPLGRFYEYRGKPRNLLVWDESLLISDTRSLSTLQLEQGLGWVAPLLEPTCEARAYLTAAIAEIQDELARQQDGKEAAAVHLRPLDDGTIGRYKRQLGISPIVEPLKHLLEMSQQPLRAVVTTQGSGLVTYDIVVPPQLQSIAILDASYPIRELERMDASITLGLSVDRNIKRHEQVSVYHAVASSGRNSMTKDFQDEKRTCAEVCEVVKNISPEEAVIIWTFKSRNPKFTRRGLVEVDFLAVMRAELQRAGIDLAAKVRVTNAQGPTEEKDRIIFRTWGQETSDSKYSYATNMVFAGVLHRSLFDIASCTIGQRDDLWHPVDSRELQRMVKSELAHSVYQAMCRGSCRQIEGNQAKPMKVWLIHRDRSIRKTLEEVMPGVAWKKWDTKYLRVNARAELVEAIADYLEGLPLARKRLSVSMLKKDMGFNSSAARSTFQRALDDYIQSTSEWEKQGRSLVRVEWDWGDDDLEPSQQPHGEEIRTQVPYSL